MVAMHLRQPSKNSLLNTYVINTGGVQVKRQVRYALISRSKIRTLGAPAADLVLIKHDFHKDCKATSILQMSLLDKNGTARKLAASSPQHC